MLFRVFDIETVPDEKAWTRHGSRWSLAPFSDANVDSLPILEASLKRDEPWPPPQANRVVAVSFLTMEATATAEGRRYVYQSMKSRAAWDPLDERDLIVMFGAAQVDGATLVSWAGRAFDLPVLALRALKHGVPWGWYYGTKSIRYRYSDEGHCDLMDALSDYGASRSLSLNDAAHLVGLPGKTDMDGIQGCGRGGQGRGSGRPGPRGAVLRPRRAADRPGVFALSSAFWLLDTRRSPCFGGIVQGNSPGALSRSGLECLFDVVMALQFVVIGKPAP